MKNIKDKYDILELVLKIKKTKMLQEQSIILSEVLTILTYKNGKQLSDEFSDDLFYFLIV